MEDELKKCLLCPKPFCTTCPAKTEVRRIIALVREGKVEEAGAILFDNNPLSAITGAVCPNHLYCKSACVLGRKGNPVDFSIIEKEISQKYLNAQKFPFKIKGCLAEQGGVCDKGKVLIVGSGPAGLALSYYLAKAEFAVEVREKEAQFGGMLRYGIPDFRLDKSLIDKIVARLRSFGVEFKANAAVDLKNLPSGFDKYVLAIGAWVSRKLEIEGEELAVPGLEFLKGQTPRQPYGLPPLYSEGTHSCGVVIIGAGNVAIDCALTAAEQGATSVDVCYRKTESEMKAYPDEIELAKSKGVKFNFFMVPKRIQKFPSKIEGCLAEQGGVCDKFEVIFDCQGKEIIMPADKVIIAIGQSATENGLLNPKTLGKNVYAIGDAVTGPKTIIEAVAAAKKLAIDIAAKA